MVAIRPVSGDAQCRTFSAAQPDVVSPVDLSARKIDIRV
jgi:hypothetical protein